MDVEVRRLREGEGEQAWELNRQAFATPAERRDNWLDAVVPSRTHGVFLGERLVAMGIVLELGQHFGGRRVPMGGVASVAVAPEHRGRGFASMVLQDMVPAMRGRGEVISALSPATTRLYRGLGWEIAGVHGERAVASRSLSQLPAGAADRVRRADADDLPAIRACYARVAPSVDGFLDRPDPYWRYQVEARWDELHAYVVDGDDGDVDGYVLYTQQPVEGWGHGIRVLEVVAAHADAAVALWRTVGSSASQVQEVVFRAPPEDPLFLLLPEQDLRERFSLRWMLRLIDAPGAVAARGFPPGLDVSIDLDVRDRLCEWNAGRWRLTVADGRGRLAQGGTGSVAATINALSSLWAGYASARTLAGAGMLAGATPAELAALDAAFSGPTPWMPDSY